MWSFDFFRGIRSLATGNLNMFTLITVGVCAYGFSLIATLTHLFPDSFQNPKPASSILFLMQPAMIIVLHYLVPWTSTGEPGTFEDWSELVTSITCSNDYVSCTENGKQDVPLLLCLSGRPPACSAR